MAFGNRINEISKKYEKEIDEYKFIQFVLNKQNLETKKYADSKGIKMIADRQVAFSDRDTWAYQSLSLTDGVLDVLRIIFQKTDKHGDFL